MANTTVFYSHDLGAAELLLFYYREFLKKNPAKRAELWAMGYAADMYKKEVLRFRYFKDREGLISYFRGNKSSVEQLVTGTSQEEDSDYILWKEARALAIPSAAYVDHWMNLIERFDYGKEFFTPDKICVIDEYCKSVLVRHGVDGADVEITGHPLLTARVEKLKELRNDPAYCEAVRKKLGIDRETKINLFISEDMTELGLKKRFGYDEFDSFRSFRMSVRGGALIVKIHPRERRGKWEDFVKKDDVRGCLLVYNEIEPLDLLAIADNVGGLFSILLALAHLAGVKTVSHQPNLKCDNYLRGSLAEGIKTVI